MYLSQKQRVSALIITTGLTLLASPAMANAGTPLMWAGMFHLFIGNALIGLIEGAVLAKLFKAKWNTAAWIMIVANYASMLAGYLAVGAASAYASDTATLNLNNIGLVLAMSVMALFLATVIIEWPFCHWTLRIGTGKPVSPLGSLKASLIVQSVSYALLIIYYAGVSPITAITDFHVDRSLSFARQSKAVVYYISVADGAVYSSRLDGSRRQKVASPGIKETYARLLVRKAARGEGLDLSVYGHPGEDATAVVAASFARGTTPPEQLESNNADTYMNFGSPIDLRKNRQGEWSVRTGFWAAEGLRAESTSGRYLRAAIETPFAAWSVRNATILPGDFVVCQMGDQIVVIDLNNQKIGLLAMGRGPVAIIKSN